METEVFLSVSDVSVRCLESIGTDLKFLKGTLKTIEAVLKSLNRALKFH